MYIRTGVSQEQAPDPKSRPAEKQKRKEQKKSEWE
jgi:hypothetical protein